MNFKALFSAALLTVLTIPVAEAHNHTTEVLLAKTTKVPKAEYTILGLTTNNKLVTFGSSRSVSIKGMTGKLVAIDVRPADGKLYGLTDRDGLYTINPTSGQATQVSTLNASFNGGFQGGIDFNPVVDRLRVVGSNDQNLRVNVLDGSTTIDKPLTFASTDVNVGVDPNITGTAYLNSFAGTTATVLYGVDYDLDVLVRQAPPNDGTLNTVGSLGIDLAPIGGFDVFTTKAGVNLGFLASSKTLYSVNLLNGATTKVGTLSQQVIGLAVLRR